MTTGHNRPLGHEDAREIAEIFTRQLNWVRQRIEALRNRRDQAAELERGLLHHQELAWERGIALLNRGADCGAARVAALLSEIAERTGPGREVFAAMATMIAIRAAWSSARRTDDEALAGDGFLL